MKEKLDIVYGDICKFEADAVVCQGNIELEMEDDITISLIDQGGEKIQVECHNLGSLQKGEAAITTAGKLPAKFMIHAIINNMGENAEEDSLMFAIRNSLNLAKEKDLPTLMMPLIGSSVGIPIRRAAELMLAEIKRHLENESSIQKITLISEDVSAYDAFVEGVRQL